MAGLLTYPLPEPSHLNGSGNDFRFLNGLTAAGTVPDSHRIPFSSVQPGWPTLTIDMAKVVISFFSTTSCLQFFAIDTALFSGNNAEYVAF